MNKFYDQISEYLSDQLSATDKSAFEAAMKQDPTLQSAIDHRHTLGDVADGFIEADISKNIASVRAELHQKESTTNQSLPQSEKSTATALRIRMYRKIAVAAAFIALLGMGYFYLNQQQPIDHDALYASYYRSPVVETVRGEATDSKLDTSLHCDLGHQAMEQAKYKQAIELFEKINAAADQTCKQKAEWYTALAQLKLNRTAEVKQALKIIAARDDHDYRDKAKQLLAKLN